MSTFSKNFFVYFHDKGCVFSTHGLHEIAAFANSNYRYQNFTPSEYIDLLNTIKEPTVLSSQRITIQNESNEYVTFLYPLHEDFRQITATAVFCVPTNQITSLFSGRLGEYNTSTYIFDSDSHVIVSSNPIETFSVEDLTSFQRDYHIIEHQSTENSWRYITLLPKKQPILSKLLSTGRTFMLYFNITLLLSSILIWYMMKVNYNPIRVLHKKASTITDDIAERTELDTISYALDYLQEQNSMLNTEVINSQTLVTNSCLRKLLNGGYSTAAEFNDECRSLGLHYSGNYFFAAVVLFHHANDCTEDHAKAVCGMLQKHFESNYIYNLEENRLITINNVSESNKHIVTDAFCNMLKVMSQQYSVSATVGVGTLMTDTSVIGRSYMEAQSALDYRFVKGNGTIILYSDILPTDNTMPSYPSKQFERLHNAIAAMDASSADIYIKELLGYITTNNLPLFMARGICFDILRTVSEGNSSHAMPDNDILQRLASADTAQEAVGMIQSLQSQLAHERGKQDISPKKLSEQVKKYIEEHCYSCDFSIQNVSEVFGILPSNLSAIFKSQTGGNIMDFVIDLRIQHAKELLKNTDMLLGEVSTAVGYYNVSSFIRRFRRHQGVTPGAYRSVSQKKL